MKQKLLFLVICCSILPNHIIAQDILWTYDLSNESENNSDYFWEDEKGNYVFNIRRHPRRIDDTTSIAYSEAFLLKLTSDGKFNGTLQVKACKNRALIYPWLKNKYITYGSNCTSEQNRFSYDTRIFNKRGKLLQTSDFRPPIKSLMHLDYDMFTSFSSFYNPFYYHNVYICYLDKKLNIDYDTILVKSLALEGYGATLHMAAPFKIANKEWVLPIDYGLKSGFNGLKLEFGGFFVTKNNQLKWKYTPNEKYYYFGAFTKYQNNIIALQTSSNRKIQYIKYFNQDGNLINEYQFKIPGTTLQAIQIFDTTIVTLSKHFYNKTHHLSYYNIQGELLKTIDLPKTFYASNFKVFSDRSIIVTGSKNHRTFIIKIGDKSVSKDEEKLGERIQYSTLEKSSEKINSVNLFPNPASDVLNIQIELASTIRQKKCIVQIFDIKGSKVKEEIARLNQVKINVANLKSGTYVYKIIIGDLEHITGEFIKL